MKEKECCGCVSENKVAVCECTIIHSDTIDRVKKRMPDVDTLSSLANLFKNFSDLTRVKILRALSEHEMCVCDIAALFSMTVSLVSHQLKTLKNADLVKCRREGKVVYYSLADDHVKTILAQGFDHVNE